VIRPGQVYWNYHVGAPAVVYFVSPAVIRAVMLKPMERGRRSAAFSVAWKNGVPDHCELLYDPPQRSEE